MKQLHHEKKLVHVEQLIAHSPEEMHRGVLEHKLSRIPNANTQSHNPEHLEKLGRI